jgi:hypothetical protein
VGVAALAAVMCLNAAAQSTQNPQDITPPANAQLPTPAPLADVHYDYHWEVYGGVAYSHFDAGPNVLQGANLGGFDARAIRELNTKWGVGVNVRGYYGTSGVACCNTEDIKGPFVSEHIFAAGPEYRLLSNQHAAMMLHAFFGGAYGDFQHALDGLPPQQFGFFSNQFTEAAVLGGSIDLNRSPRLVFRIAPDATLTNFGNNGFEEQFALSVGVAWRMGHRFGQKK